MRKFNTISPKLWRSARFLCVSDDAQRLHLFLLTGPHQNLAGVYHFPEGLVTDCLGWDAVKYSTARNELIEQGLIRFDESTSELMILRWCRHSIHNRNCYVGAKRILEEQIESPSLKADALVELEEAWTGRNVGPTLVASNQPENGIGDSLDALLDRHSPILNRK